MSDAESAPDAGPGPEAGDDSGMRTPQIEKVVVHMGVGTGGRELERAEGILRDLTGQAPVRTQANSTIPAFDIRQGDPIGAKVTLRGDRAEAFLETALDLVELRDSQFDEYGNVSFGVPEHTDFPDQEYDPSIGIFGLDVTVNLIRPGYRVRKRKIASRSIPANHRLGPAGAIDFLETRFDATIVRGDDA